MGDVTEVAPAGACPIGVDEAKAYLRIEHDAEDALLAGLVRSATALAEAFTGQWLMARDATQVFAPLSTWQRLGVVPVRRIDGVDGEIEGVWTPLPGWAYELDIDAGGWGWLRIINAMGAKRVQARFNAGLGGDWNGVPEPLRQGIARLVGHLHAHRDAADDAGPPAAVAALWRPYRRMRLG